MTIAAHKNYLELLYVLLDHPNIDINIVTGAEVRLGPHCNSFGNNTALIYACEADNPKVVEKLLRQPGINTMVKNSDGYTALHVAAGWSAQCVKLLAEADPHLNWNCETYWGVTPLYIGLREGNAGAVEIIIAQEKVDFSIKDNYGWSYAEACVFWDHGDSLKCLQLMTGVSAVDWNSKLLSDCDSEPPLIYLLKRNKLEKYKVLVKCTNVDLSCKDKNGDGLEKIAR